MSQTKSLSPECEEHLNNFLNYLKYFSDKCNVLSSISHMHYEDKYGLSDFFKWCSQDLNKMSDKIADFIKDRNGNVHLKDLIAVKFNPENEKRIDLHSCTPYELVDYLHKEDTHYNEMLNDLIHFAEKQDDKGLKHFFVGYKDELTNWNRKFDESLYTMRTSTTSSKMTEKDLDHLFQDQFNKIKNFRQI